MTVKGTRFRCSLKLPKGEMGWSPETGALSLFRTFYQLLYGNLHLKGVLTYETVSDIVLHPSRTDNGIGSGGDNRLADPRGKPVEENPSSCQRHSDVNPENGGIQGKAL